MAKITNQSNDQGNEFWRAHILEDGELISADKYTQRTLRGYYASIGYQGERPGDLFAMYEGPYLLPAYDEQGHRLNAGEHGAGQRYDIKTGKWE